MEKFGIFELLDTLSALITPQDDSQKVPKTPEPTSAPPNARDAVFAPPAYGAAATETAGAETNAVASLLERHDKMSRRIDQKK